jgi:hypothetical protein
MDYRLEIFFLGGRKVPAVEGELLVRDYAGELGFHGKIIEDLIMSGKLF